MIGGIQDEVSNLLRMRDQGQVTGLDLDRLGLHPTGHEALQLGRDRPVFRGDGVPTRLSPPGRLRRLPRKQGVRDAPLHGVEDPCLGGLDIAGEILEERFLAQLRETARVDEAGAGRRHRVLGGERGVVFAGIRSARRPSR